MLGRSANGMHWMFRYLERAENTARLVDAGFHLAKTRDSRAASDEWRSVLITLGQAGVFTALHANEEFSGELVYNFILRERNNPGSIINTMELARTNARAVRTELTKGVWEATNEAWLILKDMLARPVGDRKLGEALATIRRQMAIVRGEFEGGMLRRESYRFARMGTFIERADNAARILDVKYYVLLPNISWVGSSLDNAQWETILRSFAGERAYRWLNAGGLDQRGIAQFLILDRRFPRSLSFCYDSLNTALAMLAEEYGEEASAHSILRDAASDPRRMTVDEIFEEGLHEFLTRFIAKTGEIGAAIAADYRFVE
jgi:uncharacterized alpha-E superfamily protein